MPPKLAHKTNKKPIPKSFRADIIGASKPKKKRAMTEQSLQSQVVQYLQSQYPNALFSASFGGISASSVVQGKLAKLRGCRAGVPDLQIFERPGNSQSPYIGCLIELKSPGKDIRRPPVNSALGDARLEEDYPQYYWLRELKLRGYCVAVVDDLYQARCVIDSYLGRGGNALDMALAGKTGNEVIKVD